MDEVIVHSSEPITLVGGGEATPEDLHKALTLAPTCVAADSGAALALEARAELTALIGDFDSLTDEVRAQVPPARQHHIPEQDSTDFEKTLSRVSAPLVIGVGFLGARVDHQLAALHVLAKRAHQPCILLGAHEILFLAPPRLSLPTRDGDVVSLFPLAPVQGRSTGLKWEIDGLAFDPLTQIGTSNQALGPCQIEMQEPVMVVMVPRAIIQPVVTQLTQAHALRWPVRAG
jgi:thiamine pyrophosphokinase